MRHGVPRGERAASGDRRVSLEFGHQGVAVDTAGDLGHASAEGIADSLQRRGATGLPSIAVLGFHGDAEERPPRHLSEGLAEEIAIELVEVGVGVHVGGNVGRMLVAVGSTSVGITTLVGNTPSSC